MPLWETPDGMPPGHESDLHPGDWRNHHIAVLPHGKGKGDFTPEPVDQVTVITVNPLQELLEALAGSMEPDHAGSILRRGQEASASQEPGIEAG